MRVAVRGGDLGPRPAAGRLGPEPDRARDGALRPRSRAPRRSRRGRSPPSATGRARRVPATRVGAGSVPPSVTRDMRNSPWLVVAPSQGYAVPGDGGAVRRVEGDRHGPKNPTGSPAAVSPSFAMARRWNVPEASVAYQRVAPRPPSRPASAAWMWPRPSMAIATASYLPGSTLLGADHAAGAGGCARAGVDACACEAAPTTSSATTAVIVSDRRMTASLRAGRGHGATMRGRTRRGKGRMSRPSCLHPFSRVRPAASPRRSAAPGSRGRRAPGPRT